MIYFVYHLSFIIKRLLIVKKYIILLEYIMMKFLSVFTLVCFILTNVFGGIFANTIVVPLPYNNNNELITKNDTLSQ